LSKKLYLIA